MKITFERAALALAIILLAAVVIELDAIRRSTYMIARDQCGDGWPCSVQVKGTVELNEYSIRKITDGVRGR